MDDRRTPMEAEVQELPGRAEPCPPEDFYGTAAKPQTRRSHTGLWVLLSLTVIVLCTVAVVAALGRVQLDRREGSLHLFVNTPEEEADTSEDLVRSLPVSPDSQTLPQQALSDDSFNLKLERGSRAALGPEQIYQALSPAVVCVQTDTYPGVSTNTGVVISEEGYILSASLNNLTGSSLTVTFQDGSAYTARCLNEDMSTGVCLLKVEATGLPTVSFSDSESLAVGQRTYCIGNPYGSQLPNVFYEGMLSACRTVEADGSSLTVLQSSCQLQDLGWGCPLLDDSGRVVGLTAPVGGLLSDSLGESCLALSAPDLARIVEELENTASDSVFWLGFEVAEIPEEYQFFYGFPGSLWVVSVEERSALYNVLFQYDVITAVDDVLVFTLADYHQALAVHSPGDTITLTIFRNGKFYVSTVTLKSG